MKEYIPDDAIPWWATMCGKIAPLSSILMFLSVRVQYFVFVGLFLLSYYLFSNKFLGIHHDF